MEATTGFEPVMKVLQTSALPLGYVAPLEAPCTGWAAAGDAVRRALHASAPARTRGRRHNPSENRA